MKNRILKIDTNTIANHGLFSGVLSAEQAVNLSSEYLTNGIFSDVFEFGEIKVSGFSLAALASVTKFGVSPQDELGFHLSAPTIFRIVAQLAVIHGHVLFGLEKKTVEVWVREHYFKHRWPMRDPLHVDINYRIDSLKTAPSNSDMLGFNFSGEIGGGSVIGYGSAFYDLSKVPGGANGFLENLGIKKPV